MKNQKEFVAVREVDGTRGIQEILVIDGVVVEVKTEPKSGIGYYEGFGQDELIGKQYKSLRGWGFRKKQSLPINWFEGWHYYSID